MPRWKWFQRSNEPVDVVQRPDTNERPRAVGETVKRNDPARIVAMVRPSAIRASQLRPDNPQKRRNGGEP